MAPIPAPIFCAERQRLIAEFTAAASEHLQLLSEQIKSVALGHGFGLEPEIAAVRQRKDEAKYAVLEHDSKHSC
jgi:hypothetical protein